MTEYAFKQLGRELSNWGRWGADDERGSLNLIDRAGVLRAVRAVETGEVFELSIELGPAGPQAKVAGRGDLRHLVTRTPGDLRLDDAIDIADDMIIMPLQSGTQWDGLAHVGYDGQIWNGRSVETISTLRGATINGIHRTLPGMVGRGVLLDVAEHLGLDCLPPDFAIGPELLEEVRASQQVHVGPGDGVLVRTGWLQRAIEAGWDDWMTPCPGLTLECARWLHDHDVAAVASDNGGVEIRPSVDGGLLPLHCVLLRDMGVMMGEIFNLEHLAQACRDDGRWDFLLVAPSLRVLGGIGSPVSPIAIR